MRTVVKNSDGTVTVTDSVAGLDAQGKPTVTSTAWTLQPGQLARQIGDFPDMPAAIRDQLPAVKAGA